MTYSFLVCTSWLFFLKIWWTYLISFKFTLLFQNVSLDTNISDLNQYLFCWNWLSNNLSCRKIGNCGPLMFTFHFSVYDPLMNINIGFISRVRSFHYLTHSQSPSIFLLFSCIPLINPPLTIYIHIYIFRVISLEWWYWMKISFERIKRNGITNGLVGYV